MIHHNPAADETVVQLSGETRVLAAVDAWNPGGSNAFLQLFSRPSADVQLGTTVPDWVLPIPTAGGRDPIYPLFTEGGSPVMEFVGGLSYAVTATAGGSGAPAAAVTLSIAYV